MYLWQEGYVLLVFDLSAQTVKKIEIIEFKKIMELTKCW